MRVFGKVCKPSLCDRYWHSDGPATPVELRQWKEPKRERREESSRLHTGGGGTLRWVHGSMVEKGHGHEMKLIMASTGTALTLWAFKIPSRKIPYASSCANLMMWAHLRGRTGPKDSGERTTESNGNLKINQVWFLHENVLTKPIISYINNNACFGDHSAWTMSWGQIAATTIPLFLQCPFSCV